MDDIEEIMDLVIKLPRAGLQTKATRPVLEKIWESLCVYLEMQLLHGKVHPTSASSFIHNDWRVISSGASVRSRGVISAQAVKIKSFGLFTFRIQKIEAGMISKVWAYDPCMSDGWA